MCYRMAMTLLVAAALICSTNAKAAGPGSPYTGWGDNGSGDVDAPFLHGHEERRWAGVGEALSLPDKSVVVIGNFRNEGLLKLGLMKLTPDGAIDPDFAYLGFSGVDDHTGWVSDAVIDAQDHVLVITGSGPLCRFHSISGFTLPFDGGDASCVDIEAMAGFDGFVATGLVALENGKIWVAGNVYDQDAGSFKDSVLLRLKANGSLDTTFNGTGFRLVEPPPGRSNIWLKGLRRATNGKLIAVGSVDLNELISVRFHPGGTMEAWPDQDVGVSTSSGPLDFVLIDDPFSSEDDIVIVHDSSVVKLDGDTRLPAVDFGDKGSVAPVYSGLPARTSRIRMSADGKLLVATSGYDDDNAYSILRLHPDGAVDTTFGIEGFAVIDYGGDGGFMEAPNSDTGLAIQDDAVIMVRPAVYDGSAYDTVLVAKRRLSGDALFADGFEP